MANSEAPLEVDDASTRWATGPGAVWDASGAFRSGVRAFGTEVHVGPNMEKECRDTRDSPETCWRSSSPDGSYKIFLSGTRGSLSEPVSPRNCSRVRRTRARLPFRETISARSFEAGSPEARAQPFFAMRRSATAFQQENNRVATVGPTQIGNRQSPILWKRSANRPPNWSIR